jgi:hypothetical protein
MKLVVRVTHLILTGILLACVPVCVTAASFETEDIIAKGPLVDVRAYRDQLNPNGNLAAALADPSTANKAILITAPVSFSGSIPRNRKIKIEYGGSINQGGSELVINGPFEAGQYQVFTGTGRVTGLKEVWPDWYYSGSGDATTAWNSAIKTIKSIAAGGLIHCAGDYVVTSIDLSNSVSVFDQSITIRGSGNKSTRILGSQAGAIIVDAIGTNYLSIEDLTIKTKGAVAQTGLLLARSTTAGNSTHFRSKNLNIEGTYSIASHVAIASESRVDIGLSLRNTNIATHSTCFYTSTSNDCGITSTHGTILASSNTDNVMLHPEFYSSGDANAWPVIFSRGAQYSMYGAFITTDDLVGSARLITYRCAPTGTPGDGIFVGTVDWYGPLFESRNATIHYLDASGTSVRHPAFSYIRHRGGYCNTYTSGVVNLMASSVGQTIIDSSSISEVRFNNTNIPTITAWGIEHCDFNLWNYGDTGVITITGYQKDSRLHAGTVNEAPSSANYHGESYGSAVPTLGTYAKGHFRRNTDVKTVEEGLVGWECVVSGSPGTWVPLNMITNNLPVYSNNSAAVGAGLAKGRLYRNGDVVQVVH